MSILFRSDFSSTINEHDKIELSNFFHKLIEGVSGWHSYGKGWRTGFRSIEEYFILNVHPQAMMNHSPIFKSIVKEGSSREPESVGARRLYEIRCSFQIESQDEYVTEFKAEIHHIVPTYMDSLERYPEPKR